MKRILSPLLLCLAALALSLSPAIAGDKKAAPTPPPRHTVIGSISSDSLTVDTGLRTTNYKLNKNTVFMYQGKRVSSNDLKAGMRVSVTPGFDALTASVVSATDAPKVPAATPTPGKK